MSELDRNLIKPFLKWAGGKRQLLDTIKSFAPEDFNDYYEPFLGGGAVFFGLLPHTSYINDDNEELTNVYLTVKNDLETLIYFLKWHQKNNSKSHYLEVRAWDREDNYLKKRTPTERAARFIYMNKTGYNGLYRVNSKNQFNVPYGKYINPNIVNEESLREISRFLNSENITITTGDFEKSVEYAKSGDFVYFDPPYAPLEVDSKNFVGYTKNGFNYDDQIRLRDLFIELDKRGCYVMLSNSSSKLIHDLYKDYVATTKIVGVSRFVNSKASGRGKVNEVLVMNYKM